MAWRSVTSSSENSSRAAVNGLVDSALEEGMVAPMHLLYPGDERHRVWRKEVVLVIAEGGKPHFSWGLDPIIAP